ncbi:MAG: DUF2330 domain-containing protein [Actinomycetota bacterium]
MVRRLLVFVITMVLVGGVASPALACGGLVNPNGTVSLLRTTTLAAYTDGVEHYITSFEFAGGGGKFGSIVPLPGIPSKVSRAGDWTLQRLVQEVQPPVAERAVLFSSADAAGSGAEVLLETTIDALDITILKGGGDQVGQWAADNGFELTPDAPEVLDFYADRSPIFMAARFDANKAKELGQATGDGTPIHLTIPTPNPWVPLRILALGQPEDAIVKADVFLLTENPPDMLPEPVVGKGKGFVLSRNEPANDLLLADLRSDKGMKWLPKDDMWFSYLKIDVPAAELTHDLALDATGYGSPSPVAAGLVDPLNPVEYALPEKSHAAWAWLAALIAMWGIFAFGRKTGSRGGNNYFA